MNLVDLNAASATAFVAALGDLYEHSPWVAERAAAKRPYADLRALHDAMTTVVAAANESEQLALIHAHPELAGREAVAGQLTQASASEQGRLGFTSLGKDEFQRLGDLNRRYRESFGFPCILALRLQPDRAAVFANFERRLSNTRAQEIATAVAQIGEIARGRLAQRFGVAGGRLTTHVLDIANGVPAGAMAWDLATADGATWRRLASDRTNANGRTDAPLLTDIDIAATRYRLTFHVADYYRARGAVLGSPAFLDIVPIEFGIPDPGQHYHVPLLCTPWSYSTYRGS